MHAEAPNMEPTSLFPSGIHHVTMIAGDVLPPITLPGERVIPFEALS
jgi:hypothetical protein